MQCSPTCGCQSVVGDSVLTSPADKRSSRVSLMYIWNSHIPSIILLLIAYPIFMTLRSNVCLTQLLQLPCHSYNTSLLITSYKITQLSLFSQLEKAKPSRVLLSLFPFNSVYLSLCQTVSDTMGRDHLMVRAHRQSSILQTIGPEVTGVLWLPVKSRCENFEVTTSCPQVEIKEINKNFRGQVSLGLKVRNSGRGLIQSSYILRLVPSRPSRYRGSHGYSGHKVRPVTSHLSRCREGQ